MSLWFWYLSVLLTFIFGAVTLANHLWLYCRWSQHRLSWKRKAMNQCCTASWLTGKAFTSLLPLLLLYELLLHPQPGLKSRPRCPPLPAPVKTPQQSSQCNRSLTLTGPHGIRSVSLTPMSPHPLCSPCLSLLSLPPGAEQVSSFPQRRFALPLPSASAETDTQTRSFS